MTSPNHERSRRAAVDLQRLAQSARRFFADISPRRGDHFVRAYGDNLSHRLPLLYTVVLFNIVALAVIFHSTAPRWLWLYVSAATIMAIGARALLAAGSGPRSDRVNRHQSRAADSGRAAPIRGVSRGGLSCNLLALVEWTGGGPDNKAQARQTPDVRPRRDGSARSQVDRRRMLTHIIKSASEPLFHAGPYPREPSPIVQR